MLRIAVTGVMAGIAMFVWSAIAHVMLPLGKVGLQDLPHEAPVIAALQANGGAKAGLYAFPSARNDRGEPSMTAFAQKIAVMPQGLIAYQPPGTGAMTPGQLLAEFLLEVVEALICAVLVRFMLFHMFLSRVAAVATIGLVVVITTNGSYWNWYGFPLNYTLAYAFTQWIGFVVAGFMIALIYGWWRRKPVTL